MDPPIDQPIRAKVEEIRGGHRGLYAVATPLDMTEEIEGSVTFSLKPEVWVEKSTPEEGTIVVLSDLRCKGKSWRAESARFFRPADKKQFPKSSSTAVHSKPKGKKQ